VGRISEAKDRDGRRQAITDLFTLWWERHQDRPVAARELHEDVKSAADPHGRGRQYLVSYLDRLAGTRMAGFMLVRQAALGRWGAATFLLKPTSEEERHRGHRGHRPVVASDGPYDPYADRERHVSDQVAAGLPDPIPL
jgi:hypothetical protein